MSLSCLATDSMTDGLAGRRAERFLLLDSHLSTYTHIITKRSHFLLTLKLRAMAAGVQYNVLHQASAR